MKIRFGLAGAVAALVVTAFLAGCEDSPAPTEVEFARVDAAGAAIDGELAATLSVLGSTDQVFVIVHYDAARTSGDALASRIMGLGAGARALSQLPFVGALATAAQTQTIAGFPEVVRVSENRRLDWHGSPADAALVASLLDESVSTIKADQARQRYGVSGQGIGVAILDSGIDGLYQFDVQYPSRTVQNLKVLVNQEDVICFTAQPCAGSIYVEGLANSETSVGHGTHVGGIAGGNGTMSNGLYTGVAPKSNLIGIGTGDILFVFWALAGFDYILQNQDRYNIKVVNNSWGTNGEFDPLDPINVATREVYDRGITVVFSAGNCGRGGSDDCRPEGENQLNPYSVAPWTIGVAASCSATDTFAQETHCEGGMLADFSSRGVPGDAQRRPDVTAPGVHVISARASTGTVLNGLDTTHDLELTSTCGQRFETLPAYTCASGTSMSAPHVAGVVALMQERAGGSLSPDRVLQILVNSADPLAGFQPFEVGAGMVNALKAVGRSKK